VPNLNDVPLSARSGRDATAQFPPKLIDPAGAGAILNRKEFENGVDKAAITTHHGIIPVDHRLFHRAFHFGCNQLDAADKDTRGLSRNRIDL
jgi:hypothetical protein